MRGYSFVISMISRQLFHFVFSLSFHPARDYFRDRPEGRAQATGRNLCRHSSHGTLIQHLIIKDNNNKKYLLNRRTPNHQTRHSVEPLIISIHCAPYSHKHTKSTYMLCSSLCCQEGIVVFVLCNADRQNENFQLLSMNKEYERQS